jgi:hypothetical protein
MLVAEGMVVTVAVVVLEEVTVAAVIVMVGVVAVVAADLEGTIFGCTPKPRSRGFETDCLRRNVHTNGVAAMAALPKAEAGNEAVGATDAGNADDDEEEGASLVKSFAGPAHAVVEVPAVVVVVAIVVAERLG